MNQIINPFTPNPQEIFERNVTHKGFRVVFAVPYAPTPEDETAFDRAHAALKKALDSRTIDQIKIQPGSFLQPELCTRLMVIETDYDLAMQIIASQACFDSTEVTNPTQDVTRPRFLDHSFKWRGRR